MVFIMIKKLYQFSYIIGVSGVLLAFTNSNLIATPVKQAALAFGLGFAYLFYAIERIISTYSTTSKPTRKRNGKNGKNGNNETQPVERLQLPWYFVICLALFFSWYCLSWLNGEYYHHGVEQIERWILLMGCFFGVGLFFPTPRDRRLILVALWYIALIQAVYTLFQINELDIVKRHKWDFGFSFRRVTGTLENPAFLGGFLSGCLGIGAGFLLSLRTQKAWPVRAMWFSILLVIISLGLTFSRNGLLAAGLVFLICFGHTIYYRKANMQPLSRWLPFPKAVKITMLAVVIIAVGGVAVWQMDLTKRLLSRMTGQGDVGAVSGRKLMYRANLEMIGDFPLVGVGPGNYISRFPDYRPVDFGKVHDPSSEVNEFAHSEFMQQAIELGVPGLLLYLIMMGVPIFLAVKRLRLGILDEEELLLLGVVAAVCAGLMANIFDVTLQVITYGAFFWTLMGYIAAVLWVRPSSDAKMPLRWAWLLVVPVCFYSVTVSMKEYMADGRLFKAQNSFLQYRQQGNQMDLLAARNNIEKAMRLSPHNRRAQYFKGLLHYTTSQLDEAIQTYTRMIETEGHIADISFNLATCHYFKGQYDKAIPYYQQSIRDFPFKADYHFQLAECYHNLMDKENAGKCYMQAMKLFEAGRPYDADKILQYEHLAKCYLHQRRHRDAADTYATMIEVLQGAIRDASSAAGLKAQHTKSLAHAQYLAAAIHLQLNEYDKVVDFMVKSSNNSIEIREYKKACTNLSNVLKYFPPAAVGRDKLETLYKSLQYYERKPN
jgi:O-antigen ligase/tetratricopeptide (TPR) repeat protein